MALFPFFLTKLLSLCCHWASEAPKKQSLFRLRLHSEKEQDKHQSVSWVCNYSLPFPLKLTHTSYSLCLSPFIMWYNYHGYFLTWRNAWGRKFLLSRCLHIKLCLVVPCFSCNTTSPIFISCISPMLRILQGIEGFKKTMSTIKLRQWGDVLPP